MAKAKKSSPAKKKTTAKSKKPTKNRAQAKNNKKKKNTKQKPSLLGKVFKWLLVLGIWSSIFLTGGLLWFAKDLPDITKSATFERRASIIIKAADNSVIARYGESKGQNIQIKTLPDHLVHAVLATEDRRFYTHIGIDPIGIARAMITNIIKGRFVQGGSTITQQLAKNLFLSHDRKVTRKVKEAILAIWLERELTKDEILSAYMNRVYLGSGSYGFDAAARLYFGKPATHVNLQESAILAGLLKAPSRYSPHNNLDRAKKRADVVITAMIDAGYIQKSDMTADNMQLSLPHKKSKSGKNVRYFTDWVLDGLDDLVGRPEMDLVIETTLDSALQDIAQNRLKSAIDTADELSFISQGGILAMRPDGAVLTMVGGYDYGQSQFNRTTQALRPPGSAFKPFVYLAALQKGWDRDDDILDAPIKKGEYRPKNFGGKYYGEVTIETALAKSMNTATTRLAQDVGISKILKTARDAGIITPLNRDFSLALGSSGIPMLELTTAYATFANGGYRVYPYAITRITNGENGRVLYERKTPKSYTRIFKKRDIRDLTKMMQTVINEGTGKGANLPFPASGKTGTSQDSRDAWFAGYSDKMISVVWLGNDDNSPMRKTTGGGLPARIWKDIMLRGNTHYEPPKISAKNENGFTNMLGNLLSGGGSHSNGGGFKPRSNENPYGNLND